MKFRSLPAFPIIAVCFVFTIFAGPTVSADSTAKFPPGKTSVRIPFNRDMNMVFFRVSVNGSRPLLFCLDTGFDVSLIDAGVAKRLRLKLENKQIVPQPGGAIEMGDIPAANLSIGGLRLTGQPLHTAPLANLAKFVGHDFDGIIGHDILEKFTVKIDYDHSAVTFFKPDAYEAPPGWGKWPVDIVNGEPFVEIEISEIDVGPRVKARVKLDTGSMSGLGFNKNFIDANHLPWPGVKVLDTTGLAIGGDTKNIMFVVPRFNIGGYGFNSLYAAATLDSKGFENRKDDGTIGGEILSRFTLVLDYPQKRIVYELGDLSRDMYAYDMAGMMFTAEGPNYKTFKIYSVLPGSPADKAGLKPGDTIISVEDIPAAKLTLKELYEMMKTRAGFIYEFRVKRGAKIEMHEVTLEKLL